MYEEKNVVTGGDPQTENTGPFHTREEWGKKREYLLSLIGYSVGLGSLWRFPYLCNRNGGGQSSLDILELPNKYRLVYRPVGNVSIRKLLETYITLSAFLIPYFAGILTCALPIFFMEASIGQFSSRSATHVWDVCPLLNGIGISQIIASFVGAIPYNLIIAWSMYYLVRSFWPQLPWTTCDNWWNTPLCINKLSNTSSLNDTDFENAAKSQRLIGSLWRKPNTTLTASEEFWQYNALRVSSGLDDVGTVQYHLLLCLLGAWVIVFLCLMKGVQSVGKAVYVTATLPYLLLTVLLVRMCMMPGAVEGILYLFQPDMSRLLSVQVWLEALLQGFYSVGATFGGLITMSSYNKFHNNCLRDVILVTVLGEASSVFCGLVVFSTLGLMAHQAHVPVSEVVSSGAGLGFIIYPEAIAQLPLPQVWAVLFFLMLITIGIDSMFGPVETSIAGIIEAFPRYLGNRRVLVTAGLCIISFILSVPYTTEGGVYIFQLLEWYSISFSVLLVGCLECVAVNWLYGSDRLNSDINMMLGRPAPLVLKLCLKFVTPTLLLAALVLSLFHYDPPSYGEYFYPTYAKIIGILMAVLMSLPVPARLVYQVLKRKGSILQRLREASSPANWTPYRLKDRDMYLKMKSGEPDTERYELFPDKYT